jgi:acyl carrier protein
VEKSEILIELNKIFREVFNNSSLSVTEKTVASDLEEWDSLNHADLISAVEKHFNVKFKLMEMMKFKNVGNMCEILYSKINVSN